MVADVDVNVLDVARHLGVQFDILVRNELAGDGKCVGDGTTRHRSDGRERHVVARSAVFPWDEPPARTRLTCQTAMIRQNKIAPNTSSVFRRIVMTYLEFV